MLRATRGNGGKCPKCGNPHICKPEWNTYSDAKKKTVKHCISGVYGGEIVSCAYCGHIMHIDRWDLWGMACFDGEEETFWEKVKYNFIGFRYWNLRRFAFNFWNKISRLK